MPLSQIIPILLQSMSNVWLLTPRLTFVLTETELKGRLKLKVEGTIASNCATVMRQQKAWLYLVYTIRPHSCRFISFIGMHLKSSTVNRRCYSVFISKIVRFHKTIASKYKVVTIFSFTWLQWCTNFCFTRGNFTFLSCLASNHPILTVLLCSVVTQWMKIFYIGLLFV